ncbi:dual specificity protein phosphatase 22-B-like [Halichondria panicea]|uniref:dual specificity protein phosphatase 22-B-like n=1 Tax=Halichondria panicea TaxID=6063 RepID=UPI00312B9FEA
MGNSVDKVIDGLYVGGMLGGNTKEKLKEHNMTHVLAIHDTAEPLHPDEFTYKCIKISDTSSSVLTPYFSECVNFIHEARLKGGSVYVHCAAGISRSVTMTVMYLMTVSSLGFQDALMVVKHCREIANPNFGFRLQLKQYEEEQLSSERKRVQAQYPDTKKLNDDEKLKELLTEARKKPQQDSDYWKAYSAN